MPAAVRVVCCMFPLYVACLHCHAGADKKANPKKLFELASKAIGYYEAFIKAYLKGDEKEPSEPMDDDNMSWWITAHLCKVRAVDRRLRRRLTRR